MNISQTVVQIKGENYDLKEILIPHIIAAIATNDFLKEKIENEYDENKKVYSSILEGREYPFVEYFSLFPAVETSLMKKMLDMYLFFEEEEKGEAFIHDYLNKGYKRILDFTDRSSVVSIELFKKFLEQREKGITDQKFWKLNAIYLYCCVLKEKTIQDVEQFKRYLGNYGTPLNYNESAFIENFSLTDSETKEAFRKFEEIFGVKVAKVQTINSLIENLDVNILSQMNINEKRNSIDFFNIMYSKNIYRMYKTLAAYMRTFYIDDLYFMQELTLTREEYLRLYANFLKSKSLKRMSDEEFNSYLGAALIQLILVKQYQRLSKVYFDKNEKTESEKFLISKQAEELKLDKETFLKEKEEFDLEKRGLLESNKQIEQELAEKEKEIKLLKDSYKTSEEEVEELKVLREFVFNLNQEETDEIDESLLQSAVEQVNNKELKIAVFGGHQRFHQRLKNSFTNVRTVEPEELGIDLSFVVNMDVVLFVASYNNHSQYEPFRPLWGKKKTKLIFLNKQSSPETVANKILDVIEG